MDTPINFSILQMFQGLYTIFTAEPQIAITRIVLILVGIALVYLSYREVFEPLVLLPMGMGMIGVNGGSWPWRRGSMATSSPPPWPRGPRT